jgi:hypothetical protein
VVSPGCNRAERQGLLQKIFRKGNLGIMIQAINTENTSDTESIETLKTTIAIQKITKTRLNDSKAPGQCYDVFINELIEYWARYKISSSLCGPGRPLRQQI